MDGVIEGEVCPYEVEVQIRERYLKSALPKTPFMEKYHEEYGVGRRRFYRMLDGLPDHRSLRGKDELKYINKRGKIVPKYYIVKWLNGNSQVIAKYTDIEQAKFIRNKLMDSEWNIDMLDEFEEAWIDKCRGISDD